MMPCGAVRRGLATGSLLLSVWVVSLSAQERGWRTDFSRHTVPLEEILAGGPPKDGIPALDAPRFVTVRQANRWLRDREPVMTVTVGDDTRAYPLQILVWHEIVNDVVGGVPVAVTFCPLCNTALAFDRRVDGRVLDFGTTGRLRYSDLVMYDRQTESWWQQAVGEAIVGQYAGARLTAVPAAIVSWGALRGSHPTARVLSRDTGHDRPYGRNPYVRYDQRRGPLGQFFRGRQDLRLPAMERVVSVDGEAGGVAYPFSMLVERRVVNDQIDDLPVVVFWTPGTASALDTEPLAEGREIGQATVFDRRTSAGVLEFMPTGDGQFRDEQTGSAWNLFGRATDGKLAGTQLRPIAHTNAFWFAWVAFRPGTRVVQ